MRNEKKHNEYVSNFIFLKKKTYDRCVQFCQNLKRQ